jgi:hypothetical protein
MSADGGDDTVGGRTELERVASLRVATSVHARRAVRRQMIGSGVVSASTILVAGALDRWVQNTWVWAAVYAVSLFVAMRAIRSLEDAEPVRVKPARRVVLGAAALNVAGLLVIMTFLSGGFGAYAVAAAVALGSWSLAGWWLSR